MDTKRFPFSEHKFKELVLYIAQKSERDERFGAIKLNKILYYSDFYAYRLLGQPITAATYQKLGEGPAPRQMMPMRRVLEDAGEIRIEHRPYFNGVQQRIVALRDPNLRIFDPLEIQLVDEIIKFFWDMSARQVSDYSHEEIGWQIVEIGEDIPYQTAWLSAGEPSEEAENYGRELARRLE